MLGTFYLEGFDIIGTGKKSFILRKKGSDEILHVTNKVFAYFLQNPGAEYTTVTRPEHTSNGITYPATKWIAVWRPIWC